MISLFLIHVLEQVGDLGFRVQGVSGHALPDDVRELLRIRVQTSEAAFQGRQRGFNNLTGVLGYITPFLLMVQLPYPLPTESPEQWSTAEEGRPPQAVATTWWAFITALLVGTRFVLPNKLRSWRDPNTNQRVRSPGHFLFKLEFGDLSFAVARGLGAHINQCNRERREAGEGDQLTVFIHRTAEEQQRRNRRSDSSNGNQGNQGNRGRGSGGARRGKGRGKGVRTKRPQVFHPSCRGGVL